MKTLYVICEGRTEQQFVERILAPHLYDYEYAHVPTVRVEFSRKKGVIYRGGIRKYAPVRRTLVNIISDRPQTDVFFTTMIDLYALPRDFPGKQGHVRNPANPYPYVIALEKEFAKDIGDKRFVPHLQLHEYETLLFADPEAFAISFADCDKAIAELKNIVKSFKSIEYINAGKMTAPSKQIIKVLPEYENRKALAGPAIAELIGLETMREKCKHFDEWVAKLEKL